MGCVRRDPPSLLPLVSDFKYYELPKLARPSSCYPYTRQSVHAICHDGDLLYVEDLRSTWLARRASAAVPRWTPDTRSPARAKDSPKVGDHLIYSSLRPFKSPRCDVESSGPPTSPHGFSLYLCIQFVLIWNFLKILFIRISPDHSTFVENIVSELHIRLFVC